jgi:formate hydrogenlyase subunit 3/multisubunit Na+/H+ antiporter MnhD subunit
VATPSDTASDAPTAPGLAALFAPLAFAAFLIVGGVAAAFVSGELAVTLAVPLLAGGLLWLAEPLPGRLKALLMLAAVAGGSVLIPAPEGIPGLFRPILLAGGLVIAAAGLAYSGARKGHYPLVATLLLSIQALLSAQTGLGFYTVWEFITLASTFLIARHAAARAEALRFQLFSLAAAFCLMAGFALVSAAADTRAIYAVIGIGSEGTLGLALLAAGFLIKAAAVGVHVWQPGAYAAASDDVTALLSGVVSKTAIFGLMLTGYLALRGPLDLEFGQVLCWVGVATTVIGALLALQQTDLKRLLAYSSMSQLGYIVTAIGLMGHLGWVTALYLVASHMLIKGVLFLALAGVRMRTGTTGIGDRTGLLRAMPITALMVLVALVAMSGLPPMMGFGSKWLLLSAITEKGWTGLAVAGTLATFLGLWYMIRFFFALFAGPGSNEPVREAPRALLIPQALLVAGMIVLSFFPKLLMDRVSAVIDPDFAATLVWEGQSLETIYGLWDPTPTMVTAVVAAGLLAIIWWIASRGPLAAPDLRTSLVSRPALPASLMPPLAELFWSGAVGLSARVADAVRAVYTGNAQTYVLQALLYFVALLAAITLIVT